MEETIYLIANLNTMECYVGRTYQEVGQRWRQHIDGMSKTAGSRLAEALRHAPEDFEFLVLEQSATASEARWMEQLKSEGWTLLNETGGNRKPPRKRDKAAERAWRDANDAANRALAAKGYDGERKRGWALVAEVLKDERYARFAAEDAAR